MIVKLINISKKILGKYHLDSKEPWAYYQFVLDNFKSNTYEKIENTIENEDVEGYKDYLKDEHIPKDLQEMIKNKDTSKILFLGTGCAQPSYWRGSSAILVKMNGSKSVLLDCGEGTYGQMIRYFGEIGAKNVVSIQIYKINFN